MERGAGKVIEETAAVAAEEGEVAVAAEGVGAAFRYLRGLAEGAAALAPTVGEVAGAMAATAGVGAAATAGLAVQDVRSANNMNDATQPQHFTLRSGSSTSWLQITRPAPPGA